MIEHLQINAVAPCVHYDADGVQAAFIFPFAVFKATDLEVWADRARLSGGFSVSGVGISTGGAVLFAVPPTAGTRVTLRRRMALERVTDFQTDGIIRAKTLNDELDYQVAAVQQVAEDVSRCVMRPFTSASTADLSLPDPVGGRGLKWNADGSGLENSAADLDAVVDIVTAQATAAIQARSAADADRAATAVDRAATAADRQAASTAAGATAADRNAVASDRTAVTSLRTQAQQAASAAESSARSVGERLVGHSTSLLALATGPVALAVEAGKGWAVGMPVAIFVTGEPLRAMTGTVTAYNAVTGQLAVTVEDVSGAGSAADWTVVISGRRGAPGTGAGDLLAVNALAEIAGLGAVKQQAARNSLGLAAVASSGAYADLSGRPVLGSAASATVGTAVGNLVAVQAGGKLPALDGSALTNLPAQLPGQSGNGGKYLTTDGASVVWAAVPGFSGFPTTQTFTSSGSFTVPAGITVLAVSVGGGGGGGGGCVLANSGGGGGSGAEAFGIVSVTPGATVAVTVGAGGSAGASGGGNGGSGGTSSFGVYVTATGGAGGTGNSTNAGKAGSAGGTCLMAHGCGVAGSGGAGVEGSSGNRAGNAGSAGKVIVRY